MSRRSPGPAGPQNAICASEVPSPLRGEPALNRFFLRFVRAHLDVDVAPQGLLRTYADERNPPTSEPKSLLWRIARQIARSTLDRKARQITDYVKDADQSERAQPESFPADELSDQELLGLHCESVAELKPQCRQVYLLRKVHGFSQEEIGDHLGLSVTTVQKHLMTAIEQTERYVRHHIEARQAAKQLPGDLER